MECTNKYNISYLKNIRIIIIIRKLEEHKSEDISTFNIHVLLRSESQNSNSGRVESYYCTIILG